MRNFVGFFVALCIKRTLVLMYPLGLEERRVGIHQRQPSYLPSYNGIFSIHALNYSLAETSTHHSNHTYTSPKGPSLSSEEIKLFSDNANDLDFKDRLTTVPQMHVVTKTIEDEPASDHHQHVQQTLELQYGEGTVPDAHHQKDDGSTSPTTTTTTTDEEETTGISGPLLEGGSSTPHQGEGDIFDQLMQTIQGHWLDFVGKMKLSVLDVWKTISSHMMERLESFAVGL